MYAHWQMLFKSISSATYVSLQIALKKITKKKEKNEKEKTQLQKPKKDLKYAKTLYDYTIYNEKLPLKVHSILYDNYIICRASFKQLLCNTFLKIRNTTQQNRTHSVVML